MPVQGVNFTYLCLYIVHVSLFVCLILYRSAFAVIWVKDNFEMNCGMHLVGYQPLVIFHLMHMPQSCFGCDVRMSLRPYFNVSFYGILKPLVVLISWSALTGS